MSKIHFDTFASYDRLIYHDPEYIPANKVFNHGEIMNFSAYGYDGSRNNPEPWISMRMNETIPTKSGPRSNEIFLTFSGEDAITFVKHLAKSVGLKVEE